MIPGEGAGRAAVIFGLALALSFAGPAHATAPAAVEVAGTEFRLTLADARVLLKEGFGFAAICANDAQAYPADSFDAMKVFAKNHDFPFPYLHDESQSVARAYGAVCTPDFFGYGPDRKLKYRGRLDEGRTTPPPAGARRELVEAMREIAATHAVVAGQTPSIGCSIKWKARG